MITTFHSMLAGVSAGAITAALGGSTPASWTTQFNPTLSQVSNGWSGYNARIVIGNSHFTDDAESVRLTFLASSVGLDIDDCYVGIAATSGDAYDFASTPVQVTFASAVGFSIGADVEIVSDPVALTFDSAADSLIVSFYVTSGSTADDLASFNWAGANDVEIWYKETADESGNVDVTGYTATGMADVLSLSKVEFSPNPPPPTGAYRYWRLNCELPASPTDNISFNEIEFRPTVGGSDVSGTGTPISSSEYSISFQDDFAFNDDGGSTRWAALGSEGWIGIDFGAGNEQWVAEVGYNRDSQYMHSMSLQSSNDGVNWIHMTYIDNVTDASTAGILATFENVGPYSLSENGGHRFWRIRGLSGTGSNAQYRDIELRDTASGSDLTSVTSGNVRFFGSSQFSSTFRYSYAFDGSSSSLWAASGEVVGAFIAVEFNDNVNIVEVVLTANNSEKWTSAIVEYSDDGTTWTESWTIGTITGATGVAEVYTKPTSSGGTLWRMYGVKGQTVTAQWAETEWRAVEDGPNILSGGAASASSVASSSYLAEYLVDGSSANSWASANQAAPWYVWWEYAFTGEVPDIAEVLFQGNNFSASQYWKKAWLEKSDDDGVTWTDYGSITIPPLATDVWSSPIPVVPIPLIETNSGAHRYWRFQIIQNAVSYQSVRRLKLLDGSDADLTLLGGTPSANVAQGAYVAANAFDDAANYWYDNGGDGEWIQWDFGAGNEQAVAKWSIQSGTATTNIAPGWELQYSDDGTNWHVVDRQKFLLWTSADEVKTFTI